MIKSGLVTKKRLLFILVFYSFLIIALLARVGYIQIIQGQELQKKALFQQNTSRFIDPLRGNIYDRNGNILAISVPVETVVANPEDIDKSKENLDLIARKLENILGISKEEVIKKLTNDSYYEIIKRKVDKDTANEIRDFAKESKIQGICLVEDTKRYYPDKNLAAHVVGFTKSDGQGLQGIEKVAEKYLRGIPGKILGEVDARGRALPFASDKYIEAQNGLNVVLTIDETIQYIADKALEEAIDKYDVTGGAVAIIMDPRNGDVLALVSKPDFDLNEPYKAPPLSDIDPDTWGGYTQEEVNLLNKTVWRNKAIFNTYEPGSTFKTITGAAALEEGIIKPEDMIDDSPVRIANWTLGSSENYKYEGNISFRRGVYKSSNPVFVRVAQSMGIETFYKYVKAFGFYDKTDIELPGEQKSIFQEKPAEIDMAVAAFGQRFTITPIQLATAYTAIANGGKLMKPRLIKELTNSEGNVVKKFEPVVIRNVISKQTSDTLRDLLEGVVSEGTGKNAYVKGYRVAGKTGTSQTTESDVYVASFVAFAPADNPVINVLVALLNPSGDSYMGSVVAAPVAGKIIEDTLNYLGVERIYTEKDLEKK